MNFIEGLKEDMFWPCKATQMKKKNQCGCLEPNQFNSSIETGKTGLSMRINWLLNGICKGTKNVHTYIHGKRNYNGDLSDTDNIHLPTYEVASAFVAGS